MTYLEVLDALGSDTMGAFTGKTGNEILKYYRKGMRAAVLTPNQLKGLAKLESLTK